MPEPSNANIDLVANHLKSLPRLELSSADIEAVADKFDVSIDAVNQLIYKARKDRCK